MAASVWYIIANIGTILEIIRIIQPIVTTILQAEQRYPNQNKKKHEFVNDMLSKHIFKYLTRNGMQETDINILLQASVIIVKQWDKTILPAIKGDK